MQYTPLQAMSFYLLANERNEYKLKQQAVATQMAFNSVLGSVLGNPEAGKNFEKWLKQP